VSSCLAGHAFPSGEIAAGCVSAVKEAVLTCVTAVHSSRADGSEAAYPHLRTLIRFDTREFFNVLALAFDDMTPDKKQRIVDILLLMMVEGCGYTPTQVKHRHTDKHADTQTRS